MRQLLWKEWRERAVWFALWTLSVMALAALGMGQSFSGMDAQPGIWAALAAALALLAGLWGYGSELHGERATFLYSRALLWKQLLAAKLLTGLIVTVVSVALGAVVCRLVAPEAYLPFVTPAHLANGALVMAEITGLAYLVGLCCSMVLSGLAGGIITLLLYAGLYMITGVTQGAIRSFRDFPPFTFAGMLAAPLVALVVLARFGLTLSWWQRLTRYLFIVIPILAGGLLLNWLYSSLPWGQRYYTHAVATNYDTLTVSPSGRFAFTNFQDGGDTYRFTWVNLHTGQRSSHPYSARDWGCSRWLTDDCLVITTYPGQSTAETLLRWTGRRFTAVDMVAEEVSGVSPDGTRLLLAGPCNLDVLQLRSGNSQSLLALHSIGTGRQRKFPHFKGYLPKNCWWQDNHTVGFLHPITGRRTLVRVE